MSLLLLSLVFFLALPSWITIFRNLTLDTYFWQTKEYRIDRVISQIKYREGSNYRNLFFTLA
ncbi:hypothetical protein KC909_04080, partial [Candidatus Dojkabacteria bacterium]|nr:hypothetical protein [Candidatus Dojkabacteria bacterium]